MSSGLYTHRIRNAGEIVTSTLYNSAHKNQQANDIPTSAGAHSDDLAMFQATTDPAPANTPTPVISLALELEQYRFVIADIKEFLDGAPPAEWYSDSTATATAIQARGARVVRSTNQTITAGVPTALSFNGVRYDTGVAGGDPFFSALQPTRLTAPVDGIYHIVAFGEWDNAADGQVALLLQKNGTTVIGTISYPQNTAVIAFQEVSASIQLSATEYVEMLALQFVTATLDIVTPEFGIELLNPTAVIPAPGTFTLTITEDGTGAGVVTSDVGAINCPGVCTDDYVAATVVNLTAAPTLGSAFAGWTGDVNPINQFDNPLAVTMSVDKTINATFSLASTLVSFSGGVVVLVTGTTFGSLVTSMIGGATAASCQVLNLGARVIRRLTVTMTASIPSSHVVTARFNINGVDDNTMVVTLGFGEQSDTAIGAITLADGDLWCIKYTQTGGGSDAVQAATILSSF